MSYPRPVHLRSDREVADDEVPAACMPLLADPIAPYPPLLTSDPAAVTCRSCLRSKRYPGNDEKGTT